MTVDQISKLDFVQKIDEDPKDHMGYKIQEQCYLCKWYIEKGHYLLTLDGCGHRFHKKCLEVWFLDDSNCPLCEEPQSIPDDKLALSELSVHQNNTKDNNDNIVEDN